jgi:hypothetical protein
MPRAEALTLLLRKSWNWDNDSGVLPLGTRTAVVRLVERVSGGLGNDPAIGIHLVRTCALRCLNYSWHQLSRQLAGVQQATRSQCLASAFLFAVIFGALAYYGYGRVDMMVSTVPDPDAPAVALQNTTPPPVGGASLRESPSEKVGG